MSDRLLKESDVMRIAFQLPYVVNSAFFDAVKALPSADRPPQGEWIYCEDYAGHDGYECSNCGFFIPWVYDYYADSDFILDYHTCPRCYARMRGASNETDSDKSK